jgi:hypothetical protein
MVIWETVLTVSLLGASEELKREVQARYEFQDRGKVSYKSFSQPILLKVAVDYFTA